MGTNKDLLRRYAETNVKYSLASAPESLDPECLQAALIAVGESDLELLAFCDALLVGNALARWLAIPERDRLPDPLGSAYVKALATKRQRDGVPR